MRVSPLTVETIPKAVDGLTSKLVPACRIRRGSSPNSPLGIGICPRCSPRRSNDLNAFRLNTSSKTSPNRWSRSWIRKRNGVERDSRPSDKFRAIWVGMNLLHVSRLGPGRRLGAVTRRMLDAEISMPTLSSSPWMRR